MEKKTDFTFAELEEFVRDHIQSKILHDEMAEYGFNMHDIAIFKVQLDMYERAFVEGLCNGIIACGGNVEKIDETFSDDEYHEITL